MYDFIDIMEVQNDSSLPAEAVSINGVYLENEVEGYRTLYVTGRELLETEIEEQQIGKMDGTEFRSKRNTTRVITVTYRLMGDTPEEFRQRFNKLSRILNQEEVKLIFYDEPDKYFIGTKSTVDELPGGVLNVTGSFQFYCTDPYKYAATEKTFQAASGSSGIQEATIVNNGAAAVPIDYTITHKHENGYIGIVSENGTIQLGHKEEVDKVLQSKSETLINYKSPAAFDAMTTGQGILGYNYDKSGSFKTVSAEGKQWLAVNNIGSGDSWHGASKMVTLPADSKGEIGAQNFLAQGKIWYETGLVAQTGLMELSIGDMDGKHLASIRVAKYELGKNTAYAIFDIMGVEKKRVSFEPSYKGYTTSDKGVMYIRKSGEVFEFCFGGKKTQYRVPGAANKKAKTVSIFIGQHGTVGSDKLVTRMYFNYVYFNKDNVTRWVDIPNRYGADSVVFVDGSDSKVYVDGVVRMEDEILGSTYFLAPPGKTKVQFCYSTFSSPPPAITAKIREAYL